MTGWRLKVAAVALAASLGVPGMARAEEYPETAGWGALAVLANVVYMPAKAVYAVMGGLTGGIAYVCTAGNLDTATDIWEMSLGGTYVLTPSMLRGETPIAFAGSTSSAGRSGAASGYDGAAEGSAPTADPTAGQRDEELLPSS
jgi:hypothetical protein